MLVSFFFWTLPAVTPLSYKQTEWLGPDRYIRCMKYLGGALPATQLPDQFGPGEETKHIVNYVQWPCRAPSSLSGLDGKYMKHRPHFGQCTCRSPRNLSRVDLWSTCHLWQWQAHCAPSTLSNPTHISHRYLFSVWSSSPLHHWAGEVKQRPAGPSCYGASYSCANMSWKRIAKWESKNKQIRVK